MTDLALLIGFSLLAVLISGLISCLETVAMLADDFKVRSIVQRRGLSKFKLRMITAVSDGRDQHMVASMILQVAVGVISNSTIGILAYKLFSGGALLTYMGVSIYANIVMARSLPKVLARNHFESILVNLSWLIRLAFFVTYPVVVLTTIWIRLFRLDRKRALRMSELKDIVNYYSVKGVIGHLEENILQNALMLQRVLVKDMKPSRGMISVDANLKLTELEPQIAGQHDTYFIIHDHEGVVGVISTRDAALAVMSDRNATAGDVARGVALVDEETAIIDALVTLREGKCSRLLITRHGMPLGVISAKSIYKRIFQGAEHSAGTNASAAA